MLFLFHSLGNLNNGSNAGLWYVNGNNALTTARWNIGSRQSGWLASPPYAATTRTAPLAPERACLVN